MDNLVARVLAAGGAASVFTWLSVKLWVEQYIKEKEAMGLPVEMPKFKTNIAAIVFALIWGLVASILLHRTLDWFILGEWVLTALIAAGVATLGHEMIKNYGNRSVVVGGDSITIDSISESDHVAIGKDSEAK